MNVRRSLATAAAAAPLLLALAACGNGDTVADKAPTTSSASSGANAVAVGDTLSAGQFGDVLTNAIDKATTAHLTLDLGHSMGSAQGDADFTKSPPNAAISLSIDQLGGGVEVRLVDGTAYLKSATFGDKWVSMPMDGKDGPMGDLGDQLDVAKTLKNFADAVVSATNEGTDQVDGESLVHYTTTVDTQKLVSMLPPAAAGSLPKTVTQDWWFDSDGLIRKFSSDIGSTTTTLTFSNWGEDVSIEAPPADQVRSMPGSMSGSMS